MGFLKRQYCEMGHFFKNRLQFFFWPILGGFIILSIVSYLFYSQIFTASPDAAYSALSQIGQMFVDKGVVELGGSSFLPIFLNNLWVAALSILLGFIPFLFLSAYPVLSNALILGMTLALSNALLSFGPG